MLKIRKIILENFQSHQYSELEFDPGLNTILGPTDSGKTAIFRAIRWALYNEPSGDYFIREGESEVSVSIEFSDGTIIKRYRTSSKNGYELTKDGKNQTFEGFGREVPLEIRQAFRMPKIDISGNETRTINMADQLEGPFLLADSASVKAGAIGKLVQADVIDRALADTNLDLRRKKTENKNLLDQIQAKEESLKDFEYLKDLEKTIKQLEDKLELIDEKSKKLEKLEKISGDYIKLKEAKTYNQKILHGLKKIEDLDKISLRLEKDINLLKVLDQYKRSYKENKDRISINKKILKDLDGLDQLENHVQVLYEYIPRLIKLKETDKKMSHVKARIKDGKEVVDRLSYLDQADQKQKLAQDKLNRYKNLVNLNKNLSVRRSRIKEGHESLKKLENLDQLDSRTSHISSKIGKLASLENLNKKLDLNKKSQAREEKSFKQAQGNLELYIKEYEQILKESEICPTCFRPLDDKDHEMIKEKLK